VSFSGSKFKKFRGVKSLGVSEEGARLRLQGIHGGVRFILYRAVLVFKSFDYILL